MGMGSRRGEERKVSFSASLTRRKREGNKPFELQREQRRFQEELQRLRAIRRVRVSASRKHERYDWVREGRDGKRRGGSKGRAHLQNVLP